MTRADGIEAQAEAWLADDPDPRTREDLEALLAAVRNGDEAATEELTDSFAGTLEFGTAGLRGKLGPGPNRMNRVVVIRAAAGLAAHLHEIGASGSVVIGYDARTNSDVFARDTAEILTGAGFSVLLFDRPLPTPLVPYVITTHGCVAGVVVTASHNPPQDNGYKVYLGDGSQIVPPSDIGIAAQIARVSQRPLAELPRGTGWAMLGDEVIEAYVARAAEQIPAGPRGLRWVHTALHGVGSPVMLAAARAAGFDAPYAVAEQADPDPRFPTVAFPNPEEPGAIDLALAAAAMADADIVIANDPDADRCAVAIQRNGTWQMLRGDEVGALLGQRFLSCGRQGTYAASVVSATRLRTLAEAHQQPYATTLTGFKWIGRVPGLAFGYEEALGYCCDPAMVKDKDGITAALHVLALAAQLKSEGRTVADALDDLDREYGVCVTDQLSVRVDDLSVITAAMDRLRRNPPATLLGEKVAVVDLAEGSAELPPTDGILLTGENVRVVVRPSGTEPKLKCYLEVRGTAADEMHRLRHAMAQALGL